MVSIEEVFMHMALEEARTAEEEGEVPVGAVLLDEDNHILCRTHNRTISSSDPCAHAEIIALRQGGLKRSNYRLLDTTLYVTIEPCVMCMGAIIHARVKRLVYGAPDAKWGAAGSLYNLCEDPRFNHRVDVRKGVCETQCRYLIQQFFRKRRANRGHSEPPHS